MNKLWIKAIRRHKPMKDVTVSCEWGEQKDTLREAMKDMDYPCPMWLTKHEKDFDSFRRVVFKREDFVEDVPFDMLEVEYLDDSEKKKRSQDPRNMF